MDGEPSEKAECSFDNWYPTFKRYSVPSEVVHLPGDVVRYIKSSEFFFPPEAIIKPSWEEARNRPATFVEDITSRHWDSDEDRDDGVQPPSFPEFSPYLQEVIAKLGGTVFIKLNWSAPNDAPWAVTPSCFKCVRLQDIYLLLKSSERVIDDLNCDYQKGHKLVMKAWIDIRPGFEFRCFVKNKQLIAITQRNFSNDRCVYDTADSVSVLISNFFTRIVKPNFKLDSYHFDVVLNDCGPGPLVLLDFGPLNDSIMTYLFRWPEIEGMNYNENRSPLFRFTHFCRQKQKREILELTQDIVVAMLQSLHI